MNDTQSIKKVLSLQKIEQKKSLTPYISIRSNCYADYFIEVKTRSELIETVAMCQEHHIPFFLIGGGSNIAPLGNLRDIVVIKNNYQELSIESERNSKVVVKVSSGYIVSRLIMMCLEKGWEGMEYHRGLPGTIGGAIYMNSKWTKPWTYMGDNLLEAQLIDKKGKIKTVQRDYFKFAYDYSYLQETKEILLDALFTFNKCDPAVLQKRSEEALEYRKKTQPFGVATCGCFFQNISEAERRENNLPTTSAGYLIDQCGLKGFSVGDFKVSTLHANFIIHEGSKSGSASDLLTLIHTIKNRVKEQFNINLKEEVMVLK